MNDDYAKKPTTTYWTTAEKLWRKLRVATEARNEQKQYVAQLNEELTALNNRIYSAKAELRSCQDDVNTAMLGVSL